MTGCTAPPRDVVPQAPVLEARVDVRGPGMAAEMLEREVVMPLEEAVSGVPGVLAVASRSEDGFAELRLRLRDAEALGSLRGAVEAVKPRLPTDLDVPVIGRVGAPEPLFAVRLRGPTELERAAIAALERTPGVARVDVCGGAEPALVVEVDRARVAALGVTVDGLLAALRPAVGTRTLFPDRLGAPPADLDPSLLGELVVREGAVNVHLRDVAVVTRTRLPRGCRAFDADGEVVLLTVLGQRGAVAAEVAAAAGPAVDGLSRPPDAGATLLPAAGERGPAWLELDMRTGSDPAELVAGLRPCLDHVPGLRGWAVTIEEPRLPIPAIHPSLVSPSLPPPATVRVLLAVVGDGEPAARGDAPRVAEGPDDRVPGPRRAAAGDAEAAAGFSLAAIRGPLLRCGVVRTAAALAPAAQADRRVAVQVAGEDLEALASTLEAARARVAVIPGVTLLRVRAAQRTTTQVLELDRARLAEAGVAVHALKDVLVLAHGPLELGERSDGERVQVKLAGDGPPGVGALQVTGPGGPVALAGLVRVHEEEAWTPRLRSDGARFAALELRLHDAKDRAGVLATLAALELPVGVALSVVDDPLLP